MPVSDVSRCSHAPPCPPYGKSRQTMAPAMTGQISGRSIFVDACSMIER
jgi:hypothetical protein